MKSLFGAIGKIGFYLLAVGLVVYAGSRSLDFIQVTLPPDQKLIGWLGLLATEGGAIIWLIVFLKQSEGVAQKAIAVLSAMVDMIGSITLFTFDTLIRSAQNGAIVALTQDDVKNVILALSGLIGLNLIAVFAFHVTEPDNLRKMREDAAHDAVQSSLLQQIEDNADNLAKEMLPGLYSQWENRFRDTFSNIGALNVGRFNRGKDASDEVAVDPVRGFVPKEQPKANFISRLRLPFQNKKRTPPFSAMAASVKNADVKPVEESSSLDAAGGVSIVPTPASNLPIENEKA